MLAGCISVGRKKMANVMWFLRRQSGPAFDLVWQKGQDALKTLEDLGRLLGTNVFVLWGAILCVELDQDFDWEATRGLDIFW